MDIKKNGYKIMKILITLMHNECTVKIKLISLMFKPLVFVYLLFAYML